MEISQDKSIKITWGALGAAAATLVCVVLWLSSSDSKATVALQRLDRQRDAIKDLRVDISSIKDQLTDAKVRDVRMETMLDEIVGRARKHGL